MLNEEGAGNYPSRARRATVRSGADRGGCAGLPTLASPSGMPLRPPLSVGVLAANWRGSNQGEDTMIYELQIYECVPGRLPDLNNRFSTITLKIWEKHGIRQAGFWTTLIGESNHDSLLHAGLGIAGGARDEVGRIRR